VVPLYTAAVAELGIVQRIEKQQPDKMNILATFSAARQTTELDALLSSLDASVRRSINDEFNGKWQGWVDQTSAWEKEPSSKR